MFRLKNETHVDDPRLDRVASSISEHLEKYPLTTSTMPSTRSSMLLGIRWYANFDMPRLVKINGINRYVIGDGSLGSVRGGHAVCGRNWHLTDLKSWYRHYDQLKEGRCVEFATLRVLSQMNRVMYDTTSRWHYHTMQHADEYRGCYLGHDGGQYEGTTGRAGLEVVRRHGAIPRFYHGRSISQDMAPSLVRPKEGISAYRWAMTWEDVRTALEVPSYLPGIPINNSWGPGYPKEVILLDAAGEKLLREGGEFGIVTDR